MIITIIATSQGNREKEFNSLLDSLNKQSNRNFEIVFVDQTKGSYSDLIKSFPSLNVRVVDTEKISLSKARNIGLKYSCAKFVCFSDDDAIYHKNFVDYISQLNHSTCLPVMSFESPDLAYGGRRFYSKSDKVKYYNVFNYALSLGMVMNREEVLSLSGFDERFGAGARWGGSEETDLCIRYLKNVSCLKYIPKKLIYHRDDDIVDGNVVFFADKYEKYALGYSKCIVNNLSLKSVTLLFPLVNTICRTIVGAIVRKKLRTIYIYRLRGLIRGLF